MSKVLRPFSYLNKSEWRYKFLWYRYQQVEVTLLGRARPGAQEQTGYAVGQNCPDLLEMHQSRFDKTTRS